MERDSDLLNLLELKRTEGLKLSTYCDQLILKKIDGALKLKRKIQTEIENLEQLQKNPGTLKAQHLTGNNLIHFKAVCDAAAKYDNVVSVLAPFKRSDGTATIVDVVADSGSSWIKAIARSARGLHFSWSGETCSRERSIVDQGRDYVETASCNLHHYRMPRIIFDFNAGLTEPILSDLKSLGIYANGNVVSVDENEMCRSEDEDSFDSDSDISVDENHKGDNNDAYETATTDSFKTNLGGLSNLSINLDITALFAYISNLTNGYANFRFKEPVLDEQAKCERLKPVLPGLKAIMDDGRNLICCRTAYDSFLDILKTVGGEQEQQRGADLCKRLTVVDDHVTDIVDRLQLGGKIKARSKTIFGSGDFYKAVTLTANKSFVQAAASQGYKFAVIIHDSRALSEQKQQHAVLISETTD